jgi:hypothetical protein
MGEPVQAGKATNQMGGVPTGGWLWPFDFGLVERSLVQRVQKVSHRCATSGSRSLGQRGLAASAKAAFIGRDASIRGQTQNRDPFDFGLGSRSPQE